MTHRLALRVTAAAALCLSFAAAHAVPTNLVLNGSFELPVITPANAEYNHVASLPDWVISGHPVVLFNATYATGVADHTPSDGLQAVQLEYGNDSISQSFGTTVGQQYLLSYDLSSYAGTAAMSVSVGPASDSVVGSVPGWVTHTLAFTANSGSTTLTFTNTGPLPYGTYPHIDNVSVTAVPEAETYAMMLAGLGALGLLARRRRAD